MLYGLIIGVFIGIAIMCLLQINKKNCLHCGHGFASYCEECYQKLISENATLQFENNCLAKDFKEVMKGKFDKIIEIKKGDNAKIFPENKEGRK